MAPQAGVNGVLPVSVLQKNAPASAPRGPKAAQPRLKLVLRRLAPGLTKAEFDNILGDEWKVGAGKVDWLVYKKGKISKDAAKPSLPSRAYIHVTSLSHVPVLGDYVRQATWHDAAKSFQDGALIGPPALEYAPYHRMPGGRRKHDTRQGTIDQDQEFKDFLESLTNPISKPAAPEGEGQKEGKVTTTPLIEALRERKANKDKPQTKASKQGRGEPKDDAAEKTDKKILGKGAKDTAASAVDKSRRSTKAEKAAKDAVKVLNKEASTSKDVSSQAPAEKAPSTPGPERRRGNASIAKSMLQRDLGIGPAPNRRRGTKREVGAAANPSTAAQPEDATTTKPKAREPSGPLAASAASEKTIPPSPKKTSRAERRAFKGTLIEKTNNRNVAEDAKAQSKGAATPAPTILKKPQTPTAPTPAAPKGPVVSRGPPTEPAASRATTAQMQTRPESNIPARTPSSVQSAASSGGPSSTGRQAFLKHANPSQGITEALIEEALKAFGAIEKVEIDKRKGFAYVDFLEPEGLQKAIAGSPVKVAQGAVQVLERKEKVVRNRAHAGPHGAPTGPARGRGGFPGRGRGRGGARGGGVVPTAASAEATSSPTTPAPAPPATVAVTDAAT